MVPEPRGVCFKLWVMKSRSCFRNSSRSHIGDVLWNSELDSHRQFSQFFWSALLILRKMRFWPQSTKTTYTKHPDEGFNFWWDGVHKYVYNSLYHIHIWLDFFGMLCTTGVFITQFWNLTPFWSADQKGVKLQAGFSPGDIFDETVREASELISVCIQ